MLVESYLYLDTLVGYICAVSPVKKAKKDKSNEYYKFTLQTEEKVLPGVSFQKDLHESFCDAHKSKSPVKMKNFRLSQNNFTNKEEVIATNNTTITTTSVHFDFDNTVSPGDVTAVHATLADIIAKSNIEIW